MSAAKNALSILADANEYVALGLQVGNLVVPLVKGLIKEIRVIGQGTETVSYEIVIQTDQAELEDVKKLSTDDLAAINEELTRLGLPTVVVPPSSAT
jgi:hypothetical protein